MNRIQIKLQEDKKLLSIYFTAGYPKLNDTVSTIENLESNGVDMIEIGLPFSDPLADGPTIQASSTKALHNGMNSSVLFDQLKDIRKTVSIPLILMGYFNPILQYGIEAFCKKCKEIGIDGLIIPDLPVEVYHEEYQTVFEHHGLLNIFLITPQTSESASDIWTAFPKDLFIQSVVPALREAKVVLGKNKQIILNELQK